MFYYRDVTTYSLLFLFIFILTNQVFYIVLSLIKPNTKPYNKIVHQYEENGDKKFEE